MSEVVIKQLREADLYINNLWSRAQILRDKHTGQAHADLNDLRHGLGAIPDVIGPASALISAQAAEIERLKEALNFYANEENYNDNGAPESGGVSAPIWSKYDGDFVAAELDYGSKARAALQPSPDGMGGE